MRPTILQIQWIKKQMSERDVPSYRPAVYLALPSDEELRAKAREVMPDPATYSINWPRTEIEMVAEPMRTQGHTWRNWRLKDSEFVIDNDPRKLAHA